MKPKLTDTPSFDFNTTTHGKWILAGEHAVIRGCPALVFPITSKKLTLSYQNSQRALHGTFTGEFSHDIHLSFWSVLEHGLELLGRSLNEVHGTFSLHNNIPIGSGMGASAALCVALTRWLIWQDWLSETELFNFARKLENLFHGQSSGVDIAGACADSGVVFHQGHQNPIAQQWQPHWYLSYSGHIGVTAHCVQSVQKLWQHTPDLANQIDTKMHASVQQALTALQNPTQQPFKQLAQAIQQANSCFNDWQLIDDTMEKHMEHLLNAGAIAAKPTGSGAGGYVLSLWAEQPTNIATQNFITL